MIQFKGGLLPNDPSKPRLKVARRLTAVPTNPPQVDYMSRVPSWPMYGNSDCGDCVWATIGHQIQLTSLYGSGTEITVTELDVLRGYSDATGYDPTQTQPDGSNPTDQGTVIQDALGYWMKTGIGPAPADGEPDTRHKILAFAEVDVRNRTEVEAAINVFGSVHIGMDFPKIAEDEFNAGQEWDVAADDGGSLGGHAVPIAYYDAPSKTWKCVTWATAQGMTWAFWDRYVSEAWVVITPEWLDANGHSPEGVDLYGLGEDFAQITGKPNPFPAPGPTPQPPSPPGPTPGPTPPVVDDVDRALWATVQPALNHLSHHGAGATVGKALLTWHINKGGF